MTLASLEHDPELLVSELLVNEDGVFDFVNVEDDDETDEGTFTIEIVFLGNLLAIGFFTGMFIFFSDDIDGLLFIVIFILGDRCFISFISNGFLHE